MENLSWEKTIKSLQICIFPKINLSFKIRFIFKKILVSGVFYVYKTKIVELHKRFSITSCPEYLLLTP